MAVKFLITADCQGTLQDGRYNGRLPGLAEYLAKLRGNEHKAEIAVVLVSGDLRSGNRKAYIEGDRSVHAEAWLCADNYFPRSLHPDDIASALKDLGVDENTVRIHIGDELHADGSYAEWLNAKFYHHTSDTWESDDKVNVTDFAQVVEHAGLPTL